MSLALRRSSHTPFHVTPGSTPGRRLLLISYHFPPGQAVGALRWQKFSRYAADAGWGLDVITLDPSSLPEADLERLEELPAATRVFGVRRPVLHRDRVEHLVWRTYRLLRPVSTRQGDGAPARQDSLGRDEMRRLVRTPRDAVRAYFAWAEYARDGRWARHAAALGSHVLNDGAHEAVITCGPPHMAHEAGHRLARSAGLPHVMDLRDPWSLVQRLPESIASPVWWWLAAHHERRVVAGAALIVANTENLRQAMLQRYPDAADRVITVLNGYDEEPVPPSGPSGRFTIAYAGSIYLDRDPRLVFRAAARVVRELRLTPTQFGIELMGDASSFGGAPIEAMAREEGLEGFVRAHGARPRKAALEFLAGATMLVTLPQDSDMAIPFKVFEYMRFEAWLLALTTRDSATGVLLEGRGADVVLPGDVDGIARAIRARYEAFRSGERPRPLAADRALSREVQARVLLDAIAALPRGAARRSST